MWSEKLHYKFIESTEDGDFMFALDAVRLFRKTFSWESIHINTDNLRDYTNKQFLNNIQDHKQCGCYKNADYVAFVFSVSLVCFVIGKTQAESDLIPLHIILSDHTELWELKREMISPDR